LGIYIHAHSKTEKKAKRVLVKPNFFVGKVSLMFILSMFIGFMGVIYLVSFNDTSNLGYEVAKLEHERAEILSLRDQENVSISTSQSKDYILDSERVQGMIPLREINYYNVDGVVAYR